MNRPLAATSPSCDPALLNGIGWSVRWQDRARSVEFAETAVEVSKDDTSSRARAQLGRALLTLAWQAKWRGDFSHSMTLALDVERYLGEAQFPDERAHTYSVLGVLHYSRGRLDLATNAVDRGALLADEARDISAYVDLLTTRATIMRYKGDGGRAGLLLGRAEEVSAREDAARVQQNVARWLIEDGAAEQAAERAEQSLALAKEHRCRVIEPYSYEVLGACQTILGDLDGAEKSFATALQIANEDQDVRAQCQILRAHSAMERKRGNVDAALELCRKGAEKACSLGYTLWRQRFARECAELFEARGDLKAALEEHKVAWALVDKLRS